MKPSFKREKELWESGHIHVVGIDEVGRGAWAGPIVAAGVIFEPGTRIANVRDSKAMTELQLRRLDETIRSKAKAWTIQQVDAPDIDTMGIGSANAQVIWKVITAIMPAPTYGLIDKAFIQRRQIPIPFETIVKGDAKVTSIAAASIIAKVFRDALMSRYAHEYPGYGFENHVGYGSAEHQDALKRLGICAIHRRSYAPIAAAEAGDAIQKLL